MPSSRDEPGGTDRLRGPPELRRRLLWLTLFRLVANTLSLAAVAFRLLSESPRELSSAELGAFGTIAAIYVVTLGYSFRLRFGRVGTSDAIFQSTVDLLIATALVFLTGGAESPFTFAFSLAVIGAALLMGFRAAMIAAAASLGLFALVVLGIQTGLVIPPIGSVEISRARLSFLLVSHGLAVTLVGTLSGYLSRQLATAGGRLVASEANLRSLTTLHAQILSAMPSGLITADARSRVTFANPTAQTILGRAEAELMGLPLGDLVPGVEALGRQAARRELAIRTPHARRILGLSVTPLVGEEGAILLVFQDLTELRRLEQELQRSDRLAALGQMAAQLAHEIRNPLAAMRGSAQLLAKEAEGAPVAERLGNILVRESDRLARLVEDVLRFARPAAPVRRRLSIGALTEETLLMLRADPLMEGAVLDTDLEEGLAEVDADQFRQVLLNLVRNALQAVGGEGRVKVSIRSAERSVELRVWDSGGGIPPTMMARMFEPFFTTRQGGSGLGLATAHAIVNAHGGIMEVQSSPDAGTEFLVRLPREAPLTRETPLPLAR